MNQAGRDLRIPYRDGVRGTTSGYDAFISYSHALDGALAPALRTGLERFTKPWYRSRALRVFRDTASLSANPDLWSSLLSLYTFSGGYFRPKTQTLLEKVAT
jgi:hypothetical protein